MSTIKKILIVVDPTVTQQPALSRIAHWPRPVHAEITLLISDYEPNLAIGDELAPNAVASIEASLTERHRKRLEELAAPLRKQGLRVLTDVRWDYPLHESIVRKAVEWGADLVVKDTHYHSALKRAFFSNTDWNLIRKCPVRLLLVKPREMGHVPCVVAAVDPLHPRDKSASLDDRLLDSATELAQLLGGQTHVVHSFDILPIIAASTDAMMVPLTIQLPEIRESMEKTHTEAVRALAKAHDIPNERVHVVQGFPRNVLIDVTEELRADLLVMGAVSRSMLERLVVGSTAEGVLDRLSCDVLIVKPEGLKTRA
jgi:universal stress protein E